MHLPHFPHLLSSEHAPEKKKPNWGSEEEMGELPYYDGVRWADCTGGWITVVGFLHALQLGFFVKI